MGIIYLDILHGCYDQSNYIFASCREQNSICSRQDANIFWQKQYNKSGVHGDRYRVNLGLMYTMNNE